jgi:hypothetical protein
MRKLPERTRFYGLIAALCTAGYIWLILGMQSDGFSLAGHGPSPPGVHESHSRIQSDLPGVCLFNQLTSLPCPSCGSTRSVLHILHGDIRGGLYWNPLGFVLLAGLLTVPFWIAFDLISRRETMKNTFRLTEKWLRKWWIALPLTILVLANWVWNYLKGF